jgi:Zn-dependent M28 family amino/carboxypeptidase
MKLLHSKNRAPTATDPNVAKILGEVSPASLRAFVEMLAFPRHYFAENRANRKARDLLLKQTKSFGYRPILQGSFDNIVMTSGGPAEGPFILLGAHYDSVPRTPGADDNASAVAVCLECARLIRRHNIGSVMIAFFNREEDGLLGSSEFVMHLAGQSDWSVKEAHIFEMVGYSDGTPGSQRMPVRLPIIAPTVGDFLALLANSASNGIAENLIRLAASYVPQFPVLALKIYFGMEKLLGDLNRSDHTPFWEAGIPSIMWTDTSEFRNPHYHLDSDTPDTLDYEFMSQVAKLALARTVSLSTNWRSESA